MERRYLLQLSIIFAFFTSGFISAGEAFSPHAFLLDGLAREIGRCVIKDEATQLKVSMGLIKAQDALNALKLCVLDLNNKLKNDENFALPTGLTISETCSSRLRQLSLEFSKDLDSILTEEDPSARRKKLRSEYLLIKDRLQTSGEICQGS